MLQTKLLARIFLPRFLTVTLILNLGATRPAFALRGQQQEDPAQTSGLEEALSGKSQKTSAGLEEHRLPLLKSYLDKPSAYTADWVHQVLPDDSMFSKKMGIAKGEAVLGVASASGEYLASLARKGVRVHYTDVSPVMVENARSKYGTLFASTEVANALAVPQEFNRYDWTFSFDPLPLHSIPGGLLVALLRTLLNRKGAKLLYITRDFELEKQLGLIEKHYGAGVSSSPKTQVRVTKESPREIGSGSAPFLYMASYTLETNAQAREWAYRDLKILDALATAFQKPSREKLHWDEFSRLPEIRKTGLSKAELLQAVRRLGSALWLRDVHSEPVRSIIVLEYTRRGAPKGGAQHDAGMEETGVKDREAEVFVIDPLKVFYRTEQAGALAAGLIHPALIDPERLPGFQAEDVTVLKLSDGQEPAFGTIVVKMPEEYVPREAIWKKNGVAVVTITPQMTLAQLIQEALAQWNGRPVGEIIQIEHENGQLRIYT